MKKSINVNRANLSELVKSHTKSVRKDAREYAELMTVHEGQGIDIAPVTENRNFAEKALMLRAIAQKLNREYGRGCWSVEVGADYIGITETDVEQKVAKLRGQCGNLADAATR